MAYGFVYFLSNPSMPEIYKIGFTMKHPKDRMADLSSATGCPTPFELLAFFGVENPQQVEQEIHRELWNFRVNQAREFFRAPPIIMQNIIEKYKDDDDVCYDFMVTYEVDVSEYRANRKWPINYFHSQCADPINWNEECEFFQ